jgi:hypothetical protein
MYLDFLTLFQRYIGEAMRICERDDHSNNFLATVSFAADFRETKEQPPRLVAKKLEIINEAQNYSDSRRRCPSLSTHRRLGYLAGQLCRSRSPIDRRATINDDFRRFRYLRHSQASVCDEKIESIQKVLRRRLELNGSEIADEVEFFATRVSRRKDFTADVTPTQLL